MTLNFEYIKFSAEKLPKCTLISVRTIRPFDQTEYPQRSSPETHVMSCKPTKASLHLSSTAISYHLHRAAARSLDERIIN